MELTNVVVLLESFHLTTEFATKLVPLTVITNPESPAEAEVGLINAIVGIGLLTVNVCMFEVPPPGAGVTTVIGNVPAVAKSLVKIDAVS